jgi:hypothetical protein
MNSIDFRRCVVEFCCLRGYAHCTRCLSTSNSRIEIMSIRIQSNVFIIVGRYSDDFCRRVYIRENGTVERTMRRVLEENL